ncbi:MAG: transposase [Herpetosiphonaceae bacterium]|nr:transposase [Herpetosiphonaceae bacterium]
MSTDDFIIGLYVRVDQLLGHQPQHPQAHLHPSEIVTLALLFAFKGSGQRAFYRWLHANYRNWFPGLPERTHLFRLFSSHSDWANAFLAQPTLLGVADTYGVELLHPWREDRADLQIGRKGLSNHRWIVGMKLAYLVNQYGWSWPGTTTQRMSLTTPFER